MPKALAPAALTLILALGIAPLASNAHADESAGWRSLFNGEDFTGWDYPEDGPWDIVDGTIDCDPARAPGVRGDVWSQEEFGDIALYVEWRFTDTPTEEELPVILPDGTQKIDDDGNPVTVTQYNGDSGIYLRGQPNAQVNIWNWPIGSGEVYGYRVNESMPDHVRAGVTPSERADNPVGEWNTFLITMIGDRLSVILNGRLVIDHAQLPGVAESGPIALQFHGGYSEERGYFPASSLVQFRNIYVKELD